MRDDTTIRLPKTLSTQLSILGRKWQMSKADVIEYLIQSANIEALTKSRTYEIVAQIEQELKDELGIRSN